MTAQTRPPALAFRDVGYRPAPDAADLLSGVELEVSGGQVLGLVGPSGSGKSTLLRLGNRLISPTAGRVDVTGRDAADWPVRELRRRVQLVFQKPVIFPGTAADNLRQAARFGRLDPPDEQALGELLERVGLDRGRLDQRADSLSIGQHQRLSLARSLLLGPAVLLADEPASALDQATRRQITDTLRELVDGNSLAVILVDHQVREAARVADRLAVLIDGQIVQQGPTEQVINRPADGPSAEFLAGQLRRG